jgi:hypothetical protein
MPASSRGISQKARCLSRRIEKGRAYGVVTAKALAVLEALLWAFHNAKSGLCFPSYEKIAEAAHCAQRARGAAADIERLPLQRPQWGWRFGEFK